MTTGETTETRATSRVGAFRDLPEDDGERARAIEEGAVLARPVIMGLSHLFRSLGVSPLDVEETKVGCHAGGMLAYQYGMYLDGRVVFGLWALGVGIPRAAEIAMRWREKRERERTSPDAVNRAVEKRRTVEGEVTARAS